MASRPQHSTPRGSLRLAGTRLSGVLVAGVLVATGCGSADSAPLRPPSNVTVPPVADPPPPTPPGNPTVTTTVGHDSTPSPGPGATTPAPDDTPLTTSITNPWETSSTTTDGGGGDGGGVLDGISMTEVPADVLVPTSEDTLDAETNPINGGRGGEGRNPDHLDCTTGSCLTGALDQLGFDVTGGTDDGRARRVRRATAVVQLDAGLPMTGVPDDALLHYLGIDTGTPSDIDDGETRQLGVSATGRPIVATRYGDGPATVLVVGQTHGDEEGGLRVLLRARTLAPPDDVTLWVIPTMNPDGLLLDTRYLADGEDPNRRAPTQHEQRIVHEFALDVRPSLTVWYHQNYGWVGGSGASTGPASEYQRLTGLGTLKRSGDCAKGFTWCPIDEELGSSSILVELPDVLTPADVQTHARALLAVAAGEAG